MDFTQPSRLGLSYLDLWSGKLSSGSAYSEFEHKSITAAQKKPDEPETEEDQMEKKKTSLAILNVNP